MYNNITTNNMNLSNFAYELINEMYTEIILSRIYDRQKSFERAERLSLMTDIHVACGANSLTIKVPY